MEIALDLMADLSDRVRSADGSSASGAIDWHALRARCAAAHAARRELASGESRLNRPAGGFALWAAQAHPHIQTSRVVNLTDLADGKVPSGRDNGSAAAPEADGRGQ